MLQDNRIRQRDYLIELARVLTQELNVDTLLWQVLHVSIDLLGGEAGFIALCDKEQQWKIRISQGMTELGLQHIKSYFNTLPDTSQEPIADVLERINRLVEMIINTEDVPLGGGVGLPLVERGHVLGIIIIFCNNSRSFDTNEKLILKAFADQAAIAVNNARLYTEIEQERNRLSAFIDSAADGILILDVAHCAERVNQTFLKILGIRSDVAIGRHHDALIPLINIAYGMPLANAEAGGWPFSRESKLYVEGDLVYGELCNKPLPVGITYAPVMDSDNRMVNIIADIRDISKFREADDLKDTFISTVSHELKTPVAIIKGYAQTMRLEDADWDKTFLTESLSVIEEEADRLTGLINSLLDASRLGSGALMLNRSDIDLCALAGSAARRMQSQTERHQITCDFPSDFPIIYGDANRIEQVLLNLILNAIKYAESGEISICGQWQGEFVNISVIDRGQGLNSADIPFVFDRFYRSKATINSVKGIGLGLYLCRAIVEGHGGKISATNRDDGHSGAVFSFTLPIDPENHPSTMRFRSINEA